MPIYEYRCAACGTRKEHLQKMSDAPIATCPACGSAEYSKLLSAPGFQLKGSGWYATDFRGGGGNSTNVGASSGETASAGHTCAGNCGHT